MNKIFSILVALVILNPLWSETVEPKGKVKWEASKVGGEHWGEVQLKTSKLEIKDGAVVGGEFVVDMQSIEVIDLEGMKKNMLSGHLKNEDFFAVEEYPTSSFTLKAVEDYEGEENDFYNVTLSGTMTIKDISKDYSFPAFINVDAGSFRGNIVIDRTDFDITYKSASIFSDIGDKAIHDDFNINFDLSY